VLLSQQQRTTLLHAGQNSRRYVTESFSNKIRNNVYLGIRRRTTILLLLLRRFLFFSLIISVSVQLQILARNKLIAVSEIYIFCSKPFRMWYIFSGIKEIDLHWFNLSLFRQSNDHSASQLIAKWPAISNVLVKPFVGS